MQRIVRFHFVRKDELEPVPARELLERARKGLVTILDARPPEESPPATCPGHPGPRA